VTGERPPTAVEDTAMRALLADPTPDRDPGGEALRKIQDRINEMHARINKNGAQVVETWAPPQTAVHLKGATAMHLRITDDTPPGGQRDAALCLYHLLDLRVPDADWTTYTDGGLHGHLERDDDRDARRDMRRYATFLGARLKASQGRDGGLEWIHLCVSATYRGVPVTVWTHVDVRPVAVKS
jgi:hypothetical protein